MNGGAAEATRVVKDAVFEDFTPARPGAFRVELLLAGITFREASRRKILWIALAAGIAYLALFAIGLHSLIHSFRPSTSLAERRESMNLLLLLSLYAGNHLTSMMAVLTSCDTLAGEISSGAIHAIATKPVRRSSIVLGKWLGYVVMLGLYVLLVQGGAMAVCYIEGKYLPPHALPGLLLIWFVAVLLLSVTMACSTKFSSLTAGAVSLGLYGLAFIGGWVEQFGSLRHLPTAINLGIVSSLLMPSDALWRRAAFRMQPPLLSAMGMSPFSTNSVPNTAMVAYAGAYAALMLVLAIVLFQKRDL